MRAVRYASTYPENDAFLSWLRKEVPEEVLEPDLPIVDTHHHMWDWRGRPQVMDHYRNIPRKNRLRQSASPLRTS